MVRVDELIAVLKFRQALGLDINEPNCDRSLSPEEWNRRYSREEQPTEKPAEYRSKGKSDPTAVRYVPFNDPDTGETLYRPEKR